jgi:hypothetical protein
MIQWLAGSTWGIPIVGAFHVLAIGWFGATVLPIPLTRPLRNARSIGLVLLLATGALLFLTQPQRYSASTAFRVKMFLLLLLVVNGSALRSRVVTVILLGAMILAARAIAYF